jgi:hypothetical protein
VVEELPDERGTGGHVGQDGVPVVRAEVRFRDEPDRPYLQRVLRVENAARLTDVLERRLDSRGVEVGERR